MPEEQTVYERKRGMKYVVQASVEESTPGGGKRWSQGHIADFAPRDDIHQMGVFDVDAYARQWVQTEANRGKIDLADEKSMEKKRKEVKKIIVNFIESHEDFRRNIIWRKKTKAELVADMEKAIEAQKAQLEKMRAEAEGMSEEDIEKFTDPDKGKSDGMVTGGGVIGSATTSNARGKPGRPKEN